MNDDIKKWINDNLIYSRGLICKRCNRDWFEKYGFSKEYQKIIDITSFLNDINPTLSQRMWHIFHDKLEKYKCQNPKCNNSPSFLVFPKGYNITCCYKCAQTNPETIRKIKSTNFKNNGVEYPQQSKEIRKKSIETCLKHYGVDNVSKSEEISEKKKKTCLKNYGVEWILQRKDIMGNQMLEKYGIDNIQKDKGMGLKMGNYRKSVFYNSLFTTNRLDNLVTPLFSEEEYVKGGIFEKYKFECKKCGKIFFDSLDKNLPRCKNCFKGRSHTEQELIEYVTKILPNVSVDENCRKILNNHYELDLYIPSKNIAIELNGLYWHGEYWGNKLKNYHLNKTLECEKQGIHLIHIFEDEWIYKNEIVKNKLNHLLNNSNNKKIYARNCEMKEIKYNDSCEFLDKNHIQGSDRSSIQIGLFNGEELIAVMTFGKLRRALGNKKSKEGEYEMYRFCTSLPIIGGASKLLSHFIKNYNPVKIVSYADRRWTFIKNNLYEKIGFEKVSDGEPNYWYFGKDKKYKRYHRFGFAKHTLSKKLEVFDSNLTEWENMKNNGWDRIWDCGNLKYVWKNPNILPELN